jgi:D-alanyl-D-alanine carboxypeptidase (penicillin-binding protein 5/6)
MILGAVLAALVLSSGVLWALPRVHSGPARPATASAQDEGQKANPASAGGAQAVAAPAYDWNYLWALGNPAVGVPANRARAALLVDLDSRKVLFARDPHKPLAFASTAKLMTAVVTLDTVGDTAMVTVPDAATKVEPNVMGLSANEKLSVKDLLYGLMLDSGNDAAETLATGTLGRDQFVRAMNDKAAALGMRDTHFVNPSGLDDPNQRSSAQDLAILAAHIYQHYPGLEQVVTTRSQSITGSADHKAFYPINLNKMLWNYHGAIGFKTGLTDDAGTCLVTGAHRGERTLLLVELNDPVIFTDAAAMLDYGFRRTV